LNRLGGLQEETHGEGNGWPTPHYWKRLSFRVHANWHIVSASGDEAKTTVPSESVAETGKAESKLNFTGKNIMTLLQRAAELAGGNSRYAVEIAQNMSDQLWPVQKRVAELEARVAELEADVQLYRDKSERAELWLSKISSELQERVRGGDD
jgi:hypothetical protein